MDAELTPVTPKKEPPPDWAEKFLKALRAEGVVRWACEIAGVSRQTAYKRRKADPDFAEQWHLAHQDAIDHLEAVAFKRAKGGVSDVLLIFLLKSHRRDVYGDRVGLEHSGPDGQPIRTQDVPLDLSRLSTEELDTLERLHAKAAGHPG